MSDARFEDAQDKPLRLRACDAEDLKVISALIQDAVFKRDAMAWDPKQREFAVLLNRFRWECKSDAINSERIRSVLKVTDILDISAADLAAPSAPEVFSCLELRFKPSEELAGEMALIFSGDRDIKMSVECIEVSLTDVTPPYPAVSKKLPDHGQE